MAGAVKTITLNSGKSIPMVGFGTWKSKPGEVTAAVKAAIDSGYRHIDCAYVYGNESEVGTAIKDRIDAGVVKREDLFVTSKLWNTFHRQDLVKKGIQASLERLKLDYLDLFLIHWPMAYVEEREVFPKDENGKFIFSEVDFLDAWKGMEGCVDDGLTKSIGLSNFNSKQIQRVIDNAKIKPAMLQIECNPYFQQDRLLKFCHERGIHVTAYSPLGSPDRPWAKPEDPNLLEDPHVVQVAKRLGKSPAQVLLRWNIQRDVIVIPKSVTPSRIQENFQLFDFELSADDMKTMSEFEHNFRACKLEWVSDHKYYPFKEEF